MFTDDYVSLSTILNFIINVTFYIWYVSSIYKSGIYGKYVTLMDV